MRARGHRRRWRGFVVSDGMSKTITVRTTTLVKHPRYGKYVRRVAKLMAHDEDGKARKGDLVEIMESRPFSKQKHCRLVRVLRSAPE